MQKVLARAGFGSRRVGEQLIAEGRVAVDGERRGARSTRRPRAVRVSRVDGVPVVVDTTLVHWLLNKPAGLRDDGERSAGPPHGARARAVASRACSRSAGSTATPKACCILTNDGDLAQLLTHPSHGVEKEYLAEVEGVPDARRAAHACARASSSTTARRVRRRCGWCRSRAIGTSALVEIVVKEGRKRMVRRMCAAVGHPVRRLGAHAHRPAPRLRSSRPGAWRALTPTEVRALYAAALGEGAVLGRTKTLPTNVVRRESTGAARRDHVRRGHEGRGRRPRRKRSSRRCSTRNGDRRTTTSSASSSPPPTTSPPSSRRPRRATLGLGDVPLICARELGIVHGMPLCDPCADALLRRAVRGPTSITCTSKARGRCATTCRSSPDARRSRRDRPHRRLGRTRAGRSRSRGRRLRPRRRTRSPGRRSSARSSDSASSFEEAVARRRPRRRRGAGGPSRRRWWSQALDAGARSSPTSGR